MKNKLFILFALLFVLSCNLISAYSVNDSVDVEVSLLFDNGVSAVPVDVQACIISVFSVSLNDLVVRDMPMVNVSGVHEFSFVPLFVGDYVVNVFCNYLNDSKSFFNTISVSAPIVSSGGGYSGSLLMLNSVIHPARSAYIVDLSKDSKLSFLTDYQVNSQFVDAGDSSWKILSGDTVVDSGRFLRYGTGEYKFDFDFRDYLTGDYKIVLNFDGKTSIVDLSIISTGGLGAISGYVTNPDGSLNGVNITLFAFAILFIILMLIVIIKQVFKK